MMQLKYMSSCARLLFLLLVSSTLLFLNFYSNLSFAESVKGEGMSYWDDKTSKKEACDKAELDAKNDALRKLGLESFKSTQIEACTDTGDKTNCELYQSTFNTVSGGYIKSFEILQKGRGGNDNNFCLVKINAEAFKFKGEHDQEFILNADIGDKRRFFEGSQLTINAELNKKAFINVLGWYPDIDKDNYYLLFPNKFETNNHLSNKFQIPTISNAKKYKLDLGFPEDLKTDETQEFIIVLATKTKFAILNRIKVSQLLTRLDEITKPNWYMQKIGYSVLRRK
jgi:hypothetical protein